MSPPGTVTDLSENASDRFPPAAARIAAAVETSLDTMVAAGVDVQRPQRASAMTNDDLSKHLCDNPAGAPLARAMRPRAANGLGWSAFPPAVAAA